MIIGIDVGFTGALSLLDNEKIYECIDMPIHIINGKKHIDSCGLWMILDDWLTKYDVNHVYIEEVGAMPGQGVSSMFRFGMSYGIILGVISSFKVRFSLVRPTKWKKTLGLNKDKDASREMVLRLYPENRELFLRKKDDGRAESALIAYYGLGFL